MYRPACAVDAQKRLTIMTCVVLVSVEDDHLKLEFDMQEDL
jgi:hypothetical protein